MPAFLMPKMPPYGLGRRTRHGWRRGYRSVWAGDCRHVAGDSEREQFVNPNFGYASSRRVGRRERRVARGLKVQPVVRGQELRGKTSLSFGSRPPEVIRLSRHEKSRGQAEGMGARFVLPCDGRCDGRRAAGRQVRENSLTTTARPRVRWRFFPTRSIFSTLFWPARACAGLGSYMGRGLAGRTQDCVGCRRWARTQN